MTTYKKNAVYAGIFFLVAMAASLCGGFILEPVISAPDYLTSVSRRHGTILLGVLLELINCAAVIGIAAALYPVVRKQHEGTAMGYVGVRIVESLVLVCAAVIPLVIYSLSTDFSAAGTAAADRYGTIGAVLITGRSALTGTVTPIFFSIGAMLLYGLLYKTRVLPRFISVWGFIAAVLVLGWNLAAAFGVDTGIGMIFVLPIIANEIFLGIWLIIRGFTTEKIVENNE